MVIRKHYYVSGRVQGVGFRYRAYHIANTYGLTGYAINLDDGRVSVEVQGEEEFVNHFLDFINEGRFIDIQHIDARNLDVQPDERGFYMD